jgi:hypothetical protein
MRKRRRRGGVYDECVGRLVLVLELGGLGILGEDLVV